jgi:hypothetical protein
MLLNEWIRRKASSPADLATIPPASEPPSSTNPASVPETSTAQDESGALNLALGLAEQALNLVEVAPFIRPAVLLLKEILQICKASLFISARCFSVLIFLPGREEC